MAKIKERIGIEIGIGIGDKVGIEFSKDDINSPETQIWTGGAAYQGRK